jgi:hypothetical protein
MGSESVLRRLAGGCGLDSTRSGYGQLKSCCECGDEPSGSCATELVNNNLGATTLDRVRQSQQTEKKLRNKAINKNY